MTTLRDSLQHLQAILESAGDPITGHLAPPLAVGHLDGEERIPTPVPDEVREWFAWHDGLVGDRDADYELLSGGVPLSLDEVATIVSEYTEVAAHVAAVQGVDAAAIWDPRWLPLLTNVAGDLLLVVCQPGHEVTSPVYYHLAETGELDLAYDSLASLAATAAQCWESGAYHRGEHGSVVDDPEAVTGIWAKVNWRAAQEQGGVAPRGVVSGEEPGEGDPDLQQALERLDAPAPLERLQAMVSLARMGHGAALAPGLELLRDRVAPIRWTAAQALGDLGDVRAAPGLAAALGDPVAEVRWNVAHALGMLRGVIAPEALAALERSARDEEDETVRRVAAEALARLGADGS